MALRKEHTELSQEKTELEELLADERKQWKVITAQIRDLKKTYSPQSPLGQRRTTFEDAPQTTDLDLIEAMIEREPITVVVTQKGWIRVLKGHVADLSGLQFKGDDALDAAFFAHTTSKVLVLASNGKAYTLDAAKLPGGRGYGEPIRLMADIDEDASIAAVLPHQSGESLLLVSEDGRGFVVDQDDLIGTTRKGKAALTTEGQGQLKVVTAAQGDHIAIIGENRKLLVFPLSEAPRMARGKGVRMQRYKDGGVSDAKVFALADGLSWTDSSGRVFTVSAVELEGLDRTSRRGGALAAPRFSKEQSVRLERAAGLKAPRR